MQVCRSCDPAPPRQRPETTSLGMNVLPIFCLVGMRLNEAVGPARAEHRASTTVPKQKCSPRIVHPEMFTGPSRRRDRGGAEGGRDVMPQCDVWADAKLRARAYICVR